MEISKEKYLNALNIIELYHKQIKEKLDFIERSYKHDIVLFQKYCEPKILPSLSTAITLYRIRTKCEFIEDINFDEFATIRGVGVKSIHTLKHLLERYKKIL